MKAVISRGEVRGRVAAPSSKSYTIRALIAAALAKGESEIVSPLTSDDTEAALRVLRLMGAGVDQGKGIWTVRGGNLRAPERELFCGDSAATLRFTMAICAAIPGEFRLTSGKSLSKRPQSILTGALGRLGVRCAGDGAGAVTVYGQRLKGGHTELPGDVSSQYVSALLFMSPLGERNIKITVTTPLESKPYVAMTLGCLEAFGVKVSASPDLREFDTAPQPYRPVRYAVEGDWSSASYFLGLGAVAGRIEVSNLNAASVQGDRALVTILRDMGAVTEAKSGSVTVNRSVLRATHVDLSDCIDLLPTVAVLAAAANGVSELTGIARARIKESDRVAAVGEGLRRMGIAVQTDHDKMVITGGSPRGAVIDSHGDHRIAMAFSVLGTLSGDTIIEGAECVSKTYPEFWDTLRGLGGKVRLDEQ